MDCSSSQTGMACPGNLNSWTSLKFQLIKSFELLHKFHLVVLDFVVLVQLTLGSQDISFIYMYSEVLIPVLKDQC